jgi:hypothetical protein
VGLFVIAGDEPENFLPELRGGRIVHERGGGRRNPI